MTLMPYTKDYSHLSDEEALKVSLEDPECFAVLLSRYQEAFLRKVRPIVRVEEDAEEVVQDAFTKIYLNAGKFQKQEGARFSSWAYRILLNTAFTRYQKLKRTAGREAHLEPEYYALLPDRAMSQYEELELSELVLSVLARLPEHFSSVLQQFFLEGKMHEEIAKEEGASTGAIKTRMHRAKKAFREELEQSNTTG